MVLMKLQNLNFWSFLTILNVDLFPSFKACWEDVNMPKKLNASGEHYYHHNMTLAKWTLPLNPWCSDIKFNWCNSQSSPMASMG
jgi:hypothetical protein